MKYSESNFSNISGMLLSGGSLLHKQAVDALCRGDKEAA
jgi:hypothetical protein